MAFHNSVFVNCPFDAAYRPLLQPILFAIIDLGFTPRIALESLDSGRPRFEKIVALISGAKFAIHDLSRVQAEAAGEFYRLNMPFELGLDVGCRAYRGGKWAGKRCLILGAEAYKHQVALSDMSNSDIGAHGNEPAKALSVVRNWLKNEAGVETQGPSAIWDRFLRFMEDNALALKANGYSDADVSSLPVAELIDGMRQWSSDHPPRRPSVSGRRR
jgi:hypothetical protein